ncbi:uncharacterized protein BDR25DRAFT_352488 [Lindgomyces ingoldianus]|uniref:Uncharacterized protein n=1 Tax=Lindgomyces ingoldianus TaxID=673940 RepID=A0ACB6R4D2_9PLEO|nr:uncharacterized protein BDR25DRAFT_352488 [Lindgomyces ingoldianus]KAF2474011.1 hypothetical protein BDR25DRAFT_352488 [Lindgomyces ingoldianus]
MFATLFYCALSLLSISNALPFTIPTITSLKTIHSSSPPCLNRRVTPLCHRVVYIVTNLEFTLSTL